MKIKKKEEKIHIQLKYLKKSVQIRL